jgi:hypothetical protein
MVFLIITNQAEFEQKLAEVMLTKMGARQLLELLANRDALPVARALRRVRKQSR